MRIDMRLPKDGERRRGGSRIHFGGRVAVVAGAGEQVMENWNRIVGMENPVFHNSLPRDGDKHSTQRFDPEGNVALGIGSLTS